jgi:Ca2+-binding RTX toxin-like protein
VPAATFLDVDHGDQLTYTAAQSDGQQLPSWLAFNAGTQTFVGTPPTDSQSVITVRIAATDTGGLSASTTFMINVSPPADQGTAGNDTLTGDQFDNALDGLAGNDTIYGLGGNDALYGSAGNDVLDGGTGSDTMTGGTGDDIFVVDNSGDVVAENANEGIDLVQSSVTYALGGNVENLTLTGFVAINGTGNALNNILTGNTVANTLTGGAGDDTLDGGQGADTMVGGTENDTYVVDNTGDVVTESANQGTDLVQSSITYGLSSTVENLTLTGSANINATGTSGINTLIGNSGNNTLNGLGGADIMMGGDGNDTFVVDDAGDSVSESAGQGTDLVQSSVTFTVGSNIENLTLTGTAAINATGNSANNILVGNTGVNVLTGGAGDDNYTVNSVVTNFFWESAPELQNFYDTVTEQAGQGYDTITASQVHSATLSANVEKLVILSGYITGGTVSFNLTQDVRRKFTGNALDNVIDASLANNAGFGLGYISTAGFNEGEIVIDGGAGADLMIGPTQNLLTRFIVDNVDDVVVVGGTRVDDRVQTTVSYTLSGGVDYIDLVGTAAISATGNSGNNRLDGSLNTASNVLTGGAGNDTYIVGAADIAVEAVGEGTDTVQSAVSYTLGANLET